MALFSLSRSQRPKLILTVSVLPYTFVDFTLRRWDNMLAFHIPSLKFEHKARTQIGKRIESFFYKYTDMVIKEESGAKLQTKQETGGVVASWWFHGSIFI